MNLKLILATYFLSYACTAYALDTQIAQNNPMTEVQRATTYDRDFYSNVEESKARFFIGLSTSTKSDGTSANLQMAYRPVGNFLITSSYNFTVEDVQAGFMMGF